MVRVGLLLTGAVHPLAARATNPHRYGKSGSSLNATMFNIAGNISITHTPSTTKLPVVLTEYSVHTSSAWSQLTTTTDTDTEMEDIATQTMFMARRPLIRRLSPAPAAHHHRTAHHVQQQRAARI